MEKTRLREKDFSYVLSEYGAIIAFAILFLINSVFTPRFFAVNTVWNILTQSTTTVLLGLGMTIVVATGGINISVGSCMAMTAMVTAQFLLRQQVTLGLIVGALVAVLFGIITGLLIIKFQIQPMICSLSFLFVMRGICKLINDGKVMNYRNKPFSQFFYRTLFGDAKFPIRALIWLIVALLIWILLTKTRYGKYIESYGDNPNATYISGINVTFTIVVAYVLCNVMAFGAGIIEAGYSNTVDPANMGLTKEMDAIAATVVGGTSISGGRPHVLGTVFGAMTLQLITMMVNMNNIPVPYARIIKAVIIIAAVWAQQARSKQK